MQKDKSITEFLSKAKLKINFTSLEIFMLLELKKRTSLYMFLPSALLMIMSKNMTTI
jgi:hypothetical protein